MLVLAITPPTLQIEHQEQVWQQDQVQGEGLASSLLSYLFIHIVYLAISINKQSLTMAPAANKSKAKGKDPDQAPAKFKLRLNVKAPIKAKTEVSEETQAFLHNLTISTNE